MNKLGFYDIPMLRSMVRYMRKEQTCNNRFISSLKLVVLSAGCRLNSSQSCSRSACSKSTPVKHAARQQNDRKRFQKPQLNRLPCLDFYQLFVPARNISSTSNNVVVHVINPQERENVLDFMRLHYYREEPLTAGSEPRQQDKEDEDWNMSHIEQGMCFMAIQEDATNSEKKIVGVLIAGAKGPHEAKYLFDEAAKSVSTKMFHILQFSACVERDANVCERFNVQKVLHIHALGVHSDMRGHNIGHRLVRELLDQTKRSNYEMVTADCTSFYSAQLFERMGFQCINVKYYKDYLDANGKQVFNPDAPHECVKTFALKTK